MFRSSHDAPPARLAVLMLIGLATLASPAAADGPAREVIDGVPHVRNGGTPAESVQTLRMDELWRVGGDDDEILFGLTPRACTDDEGRVYVLDSQLNQVVVFTPGGEVAATLFREGEGPSEVRRSRDMFVFDDGRVGAIQEFPGTAILVDGQGTPAGRLRAGTPGGDPFSLIGCRARGDHLVMSGLSQTQGDDPRVSHRCPFPKPVRPVIQGHTPLTRLH